MMNIANNLADSIGDNVEHHFAHLLPLRCSEKHEPEQADRSCGKQVIGDITYLRSKLGLTVPTTRQLLASRRYVLNKRQTTKVVAKVPAPNKASSQKSSLPPVPLNMDLSSRRKSTMASILKAQISAGLNRNRLIMEKVMEFRKKSMSRTEHKAMLARHFFQQDGEILKTVKEELDRDKKRRNNAIGRRLSRFKKMYQTTEVEKDGQSTVSGISRISGLSGVSGEISND